LFGLALGKIPTARCARRLQANAARLLWNASGSALLALTASDVDATNQSYYGEQKLYFLAADGSNECQVPLPKVRLGERQREQQRWQPRARV
jgi:translation initiation factor 2A